MFAPKYRRQIIYGKYQAAIGKILFNFRTDVNAVDNTIWMKKRVSTVCRRDITIRIRRFISADNLELAVQLAQVPGQLNMFSYCNNDPVSFTDESWN